MPSLAAVASRPIALGFDSSACMATAGQAWGVKAREDNPAPPLSTAGSPMVSHTLNRINDADLIREAQRSEEHTSELQSRFDLVCRLLLEKKKHSQRRRNASTHSCGPIHTAHT